MTKKATLFLLAFALIISCKKSDQTSETPRQLQVNTNTLSLNGSLNTIDSFTIQSNDAWTISVSPSNANWLELNTTAGRGNTTVTIRITERNLGNSSRSATLTVSTEGGPSARIQTINVVQNILTPVLSVDRLSLSLNGANTKDSFKIQSNID